VLLVVRGQLGKRDAEDRKLHLPTHLLHVLRQDMADDAPVALSLDLRPYKQPDCLQDQAKEDGVRRYKYQQQWLRLSAKLRDKSQLELEITDRVSRKEKPKRKYTKVKEGIREALSLTVKAPAGTEAPEPSALEQSLRLPPGEWGLRVTGVKASNRTVRLQAQSDLVQKVHARYGVQGNGNELVEAEGVLMLILATYQGLAGGAGDQAQAG
jgi:hypothetical protein